MEHFSFSEWLTSAGYSLLAAVGGLLGYAMREHDAGRRLSPLRAVIEATGSGFVGFLVMLLCRAIGLDPLWSGFIVGIFGWLGASASIRVLERFAHERLGLKLGDKADRPEGDQP